MRSYTLERYPTLETPGFVVKWVQKGESKVIWGCRDGSMDWRPILVTLPSAPVVFFVPDAAGGTVEIWVPGKRVMTITREPGSTGALTR